MIPCKGYVEANITIPDLPHCNEHVLFVLISDHLVATMTEKELQQAGKTGKQVHFSTVITKRNTVKGPDVPKYDLKGVKGKICTIEKS